MSMIYGQSTSTYFPPRGNVRGRGRSVTNLGGRRYDYLFPGETRAKGRKRLMLNVGTDRRSKRQVRRMNTRMKRIREIFSGMTA